MTLCAFPQDSPGVVAASTSYDNCAKINSSVSSTLQCQSCKPFCWLSSPSSLIFHFICLLRRKALFLITKKTNKNREPDFTCPYLRIVLEYKWHHVALLTCLVKKVGVYGGGSKMGLYFVLCVCFQHVGVNLSFLSFLGTQIKNTYFHFINS